MTTETERYDILEGLAFAKFARRPFLVDAIMVTVDNLDIIAPLIGEVKTKVDGTRYIQADRNLVPNVSKVYPGFYMTCLDNTIRCFSPRVFRQQFVDLTPDRVEVVDALNESA